MQSSDDSWELVLPLVLTNTKPWLRHLCRLLCTNKAAADIVHARCAGDIDPWPFSSSDLHQPGLIGWLSKHAVLLRRLQHDDDWWSPQDVYSHPPGAREHSPDGPALARAAERQAASGRLAAALAAAAALPGGLMLQSLSTYSPGVVRAGSCRTLAWLELGLHSDALFPSAQETTECLTSLASQLHTLKLHASWRLFDSSVYPNGRRTTAPCPEVEPGCGLRSLLQQTLPQLTALTRLEVDEVADACVLQYAPPQLHRLLVVGVSDPSKGDLKLGHLTALTSLEFSRSPERDQQGWRDIQRNDTLPPNLRKLSVCNCLSATPLLHLTDLESLSISRHCRMPASELRRLSAMTQLQDVKLGYSTRLDCEGEQSAQEGSAGWGCVPALHDLELHYLLTDPESSMLQDLAGLTQLTRLVWDNSRFSFGELIYMDQGLRDLGEALPASLVELEFGAHLEPYEPLGEGFGNSEAWLVWGLHGLKQAVLAHPNLKACSFDDVCVEEIFETGERLVDMLLGCDFQEPVPDEWQAMFEREYPAFHDGMSSGSDTDSEEGSEGEVGEGEGSDMEALLGVVAGVAAAASEAGAPDGAEDPEA